MLVTILGPISGAHFNPAVTLVFAIDADISARDACAYVLAQLGGGFIGVLAAHVMFDHPLFELGSKVRSGPGQWLGEALATFALVLTILGTIRHRPQRVPAAVAMVINAGYWWTWSTFFAHPAITPGPVADQSFFRDTPRRRTGFHRGATGRRGGGAGLYTVVVRANGLKRA